MAIPSKSELLALDVAARLELIEELWDSIARDEAAASQVPVTEAERRMLDERLREYRALLASMDEEPEAAQIAEIDRRAREALANPDAGVPWETVRAELHAKYR